jgi:hypothetical protein
MSVGVSLYLVYVRTFLSTFRTDEFLVHMKSLYVIVQVKSPIMLKICVTELTLYDTLSVMFYVFILPIKLLVTFCTGKLFIIVVDRIFVSLTIVFP